MFLSALIAWYARSDHGARRARPPTPPFLLGGAVLALVLGLWDDRFGMEPQLKLLGQATAAGILLASGHIPDFGLPGPLDLDRSPGSSLIALMNAVNFLDNMNGVVGGLSAILFVGFALALGGRAAPTASPPPSSRSPAPASDSCATTSPAPGSSSATQAACFSAIVSAPRPSWPMMGAPPGWGRWAPS